MKQNRFTEEQIARAFKDLEAGGITVAEQARKLGCAKNIFIYGYRRIWALLRREGWIVNIKRVRWLWKKNRLQVPKKKRKQRRQGPCVQQYPCQTWAPNPIWTLDFVHDSLKHGRRIRMLSVVDKFTREALQIQVAYSLKSQDVQQVLEKLFRERGAPCYLRSDNGSEFIERALNKWLRQQYL